MAKPINPPRGMRDFLPGDKRRREAALAIIRKNYVAHGFDEIETPVLEEVSRLHSGLGGDNEKLSFSVLKRGLSSADFQAVAASGEVLQLADLGLRYDLTVPLARFYATHRAELPPVFRAIQIAPVWRAERPQKGRFRQFVQCDIDIIGEPGLLAEVELITATVSTLAELGISGAKVRINDRRLLYGILAHFGFAESEYDSALITIDKLDKLGSAGVIQELRQNGISDSQLAGFVDYLASYEASASEATQFNLADILAKLPAGLCQDAQLAAENLASIAVSLSEALQVDMAELPLQFDPFLVRGMGYYTGTIFEIQHPEFGYSLGGGGRYDGMIGRFLDAFVPAAGFSIGFERIVDLLELQTVSADNEIALVYDKQVSVAKLVALKSELVRLGNRVRLQLKPKKLAGILDQLAASGFSKFAVINSDAEAELSSLEFRELS